MKFQYLTKELVLHAADLIAAGDEEFMCTAITWALYESKVTEVYRMQHPARAELQEVLLENNICLSGFLENNLYATSAQMQEYRVMFLLFVAEAYFGE